MSLDVTPIPAKTKPTIVMPSPDLTVALPQKVPATAPRAIPLPTIPSPRAPSPPRIVEIDEHYSATAIVPRFPTIAAPSLRELSSSSSGDEFFDDRRATSSSTWNIPKQPSTASRSQRRVRYIDPATEEPRTRYTPGSSIVVDKPSPEDIVSAVSLVIPVSVSKKSSATDTKITPKSPAMQPVESQVRTIQPSSTSETMPSPARARFDKAVAGLDPNSREYWRAFRHFFKTDSAFQRSEQGSTESLHFDSVTITLGDELTELEGATSNKDSPKKVQPKKKNAKSKKK